MLCPVGAVGEIVTFDFTGSVSSVYNPYGVVSPSLIGLGDPVQASLRFDTATQDLYPDDPTRGAYIGPGWFKVNINGLDFERTTTVQVDILHNGNGGQEYFDADAFQNPTSWPAELPLYDYPQIFMAFWQSKPTYDLFSSDALPTALDFSRADMQTAFVRAGTSTANMYEIQFRLLQVPEPGVVSLLPGGLLLLLLRARPSDGFPR